MVKQVVIRIDDSFFKELLKVKRRHVHTWTDVLEKYLKVYGK